EIMKEDGTMARLPDLRAFGEKHGIRIVAVADLIRWRMRNELFVEQVLETQAPVRGHGEFRMRTYRARTTGGLHMAVWKGDIQPDEPVLARVQAFCPTGDVFQSTPGGGSDNLDAALAAIADAGTGVLLYLHVAGGGQADAVLARMRAHLGSTDPMKGNGDSGEIREMGMGAQILADIGARRLRLLTNNPRKIVGLEGFGIEVVERVPFGPASRDDASSVGGDHPARSEG
ncbi:MAG: 3,4-dihydroxy-2-butanone-4-phosphate synthase, partial [Myxococcota bacterium]|nr:3,4-dihydroxy-2-butanone-4-phosphate synthase [Myxococcota bacterium]